MSGDGPAPALSLVVPVYNEEDNVAPLHAELGRIASDLARSYEIVFVNDGSRDRTLRRLEALAAADPHLRIVDLDGNFGEAAALSAGFAHARGAVIVTLDGDGQNDPADIPRLLARLEDGFDVVSGRRVERREAFVSRVLPSRIANWLIARATGQEKLPAPWPTSISTPRSRAARTIGFSCSRWSTRRVTGFPLYLCVTMSPRSRMGMDCSTVGGGSPRCSITGRPAAFAAALACQTGCTVLSSPKASRLPRTLMPTIRSRLASATCTASAGAISRSSSLSPTITVLEKP